MAKTKIMATAKASMSKAICKCANGSCRCKTTSKKCVCKCVGGVCKCVCK